ncbi:hypothetical protein TNCV_1952721 [Trichonephila clavipes]|nr:hypothetical protein TNCV_1952721 [Trichonephila clavipes]
MLSQFVGKLDPCIFLSALKEYGFLTVFIVYQIIDNVPVIESFVHQVRATGAFRKQLNARCWETVYGEMNRAS